MLLESNILDIRQVYFLNSCFHYHFKLPNKRNFQLTNTQLVMEKSMMYLWWETNVRKDLLVIIFQNFTILSVIIAVQKKCYIRHCNKYFVPHKHYRRRNKIVEVFILSYQLFELAILPEWLDDLHVLSSIH